MTLVNKPTVAHTLPASSSAPVVVEAVVERLLLHRPSEEFELNWKLGSIMRVLICPKTINPRL